MAELTTVDSPLESLPRELRQMINKELLHVPEGLPLLAIDKRKKALATDFELYEHLLEHRDSARGRRFYDFYLNVFATTHCPTLPKALDTLIALRDVNWRFFNEAFEDFLYMNEIHISIGRSSSLGNGAPNHMEFSPWDFPLIRTFTIAASRKRGPWATTGGGKDLRIKGVSKKRGDSGRGRDMATKLADDEFSVEIAAWANDGVSLDVNLILQLMDEASDLI